MTDEELALEEMRAVMATKRFATVQDLVGSRAFDELTSGPQRANSPSTSDDEAAHPQLPTRTGDR
jgi:hypothetical protein